MVGSSDSVDAAGKKRKQSVDESSAASNQKRLKKEVSNATAATPIKTGKGNVKPAAITPQGSTMGSAKKDAKKQGDNSPKEQPSLSKKEQKKLRQEALQTPTAAKIETPEKKLVASTPSKQTQSPSLVTAETPLDEERRRQRRAEKKARRQIEHEAKTADITATPQTTAKVKSAKKGPSAIAKSQTGKSSAWTLSAASAGRYIERDPIFVSDSNGEQFIVAATAREVQVLSLETSLAFQALQVEGTVVGFCQEPGSPAISILDSTGNISTWDWEQNKTKVAKASPNNALRAYAASHIEVPDAKKQSIARVILTVSNKGSNIHIGEKIAYKTKHVLDDAHIVGNLEFVLATGSSVVVLGRRKASAVDDFTWAELATSGQVTCAHSAVKRDGQPGTPLGLRLALGNSDGQIHLYEDVSRLFNGKELPSPRILHWHRDAVSAVKFTPDNQYLISGGKETVMVLWQLETGKKQFLPHLTSEIERLVVSPEGDRYSVQMGDNSIMVLSSSELKPVANFAGLQMPVPPQELGASYEAADLADVTTVLHPQHSDQLLLTVPATQPKTSQDVAARPFLQAFDFHNSRHISRQALSRNNVTDFNLGPERTAINPPDVTFLAVSQDGQWLATVDEWLPPASDVQYLAADEDQVEEEQLKRREVHLKFWQWDTTQNLWTLTTRVDAPHSRPSEDSRGAGSVLGLIANPVSRGFVTIGEDAAVKTWRPKTRTRYGMPMKDESGNDVTEWTCRHNIQLEKQLARVHSPMDGEDEVEAELMGPTSAHLAFSEDGSTIAAAVCYDFMADAPVAHFIDAHAGQVKLSKDNVFAADLSSIGFMDRYLVALSRESVRVWDLVQDKLHYNVTLPQIAEEGDRPLLAVNHQESTFAVIVPQTKRGRGSVEVFEPHSAQSLHRETMASPVAAVLANKGTRGYVLLFADATVRMLVKTGTTRRYGMQSKLASAAATADAEKAVSAPQKTVVPNLLASTTGGVQQGIALEETEDDRPVVRPEQLAGIFDVGLGIALPSVRDMYRAVASLYSRKPRAKVDSMEVDG
jgi:NET1-associated nuclear protein 1 (U3 small nucleolar RNA-associated protein 17)